LIEVEKPRTGDLALFLDGRTLGICIGAKSHFLGAGKNIVTLPNKLIKRFWRYECQPQ
jgi:hypothetical protein